MKISSKQLISFGAMAVAIAGTSIAVAPKADAQTTGTYLVTVNTLGLNDGDPYNLDFFLSTGAGADATVTVSNFATDGTLSGSVFANSSGASGEPVGDIPGPVVFSSLTGTDIDYDDTDISGGSYLSFYVTADIPNPTSVLSSTFGFDVYDPGPANSGQVNTLDTADPVPNFITVSNSGSGITPASYDYYGSTPATSSDLYAVSITPATLPVAAPESSSLVETGILGSLFALFLTPALRAKVAKRNS